MVEEAQSLPSSQDKVQLPEDKEPDSEYESAEEEIANDTVVSGPQRHRYEPPARPVPPPGVEDYDLKNWSDPNVCSEYAMDIFFYYKSREVNLNLTPSPQWKVGGTKKFYFRLNLKRLTT